MFLPDVNILVYAHREDSVRHAGARDWLMTVLQESTPVGLFSPTLASFVRIVTNPRIFGTPTPLSIALNFVQILHSYPAALPITNGPGHWAIFEHLCQATGAVGNLIPDAFLAALAIEHDCELITADQGFARFPNLRWCLPF